MRQQQTTGTEPCANCRRPVVVGRWTTRSISGRPWCDPCAPRASVSASGAYESRRRSGATTTRAAVRRVAEARKWEDMDAKIRAWAVPEARAWRQALAAGAPRSELNRLWAAVEDVMPEVADELRRFRAARLETRALDLDDDDTETRSVVYDEDRDRFVYYDEERSGTPVVGRAYAYRWWNQRWMDSEWVRVSP